MIERSLHSSPCLDSAQIVFSENSVECVYVGGVGGGHFTVGTKHSVMSGQSGSSLLSAVKGGGLASRSMMPRFPHLRLNVTPIGLLHCRSWRGQRPCGVVLKEKSVSFGVCVSQTGS